MGKIVHKRKYIGKETGRRGCDPAGIYYEYVCSYCNQPAFEDEFENFILLTEVFCDVVDKQGD